MSYRHIGYKHIKQTVPSVSHDNINFAYRVVIISQLRMHFSVIVLKLTKGLVAGSVHTVIYYALVDKLITPNNILFVECEYVQYSNIHNAFVVLLSLVLSLVY